MSRPHPAAVWHELTSGLDGADAVWRELEAMHGEPGRHYHTLDHLAHFLAAMRAGEAALDEEQRRVFKFAMFFHDAIYDVQRRDNELRSAELAADRLGRLGLSERIVAPVRRWIVATASHAQTGEPPLDFFLDCDMSIFAAPPEDYGAYAEAIRREYVGGGIDEATYHAGRVAFLGRCLRREPFFLSPAFRLLDEAARSNIHDEIVRLEPDAAL